MLFEGFDDLPFDDQDLDQLISKLSDEFKHIIDVLAPPKEVILSTHPKQPWFDGAVKTQHKVIRNRERAWLKYKLNSNWLAYKKE